MQNRASLVLHTTTGVFFWVLSSERRMNRSCHRVQRLDSGVSWKGSRYCTKLSDDAGMCSALYVPPPARLCNCPAVALQKSSRLFEHRVFIKLSLSLWTRSAQTTCCSGAALEPCSTISHVSAQAMHSLCTISVLCYKPYNCPQQQQPRAHASAALRHPLRNTASMGCRSCAGKTALFKRPEAEDLSTTGMPYSYHVPLLPAQVLLQVKYGSLSTIKASGSNAF